MSRSKRGRSPITIWCVMGWAWAQDRKTPVPIRPFLTKNVAEEWLAGYCDEGDTILKFIEAMPKAKARKAARRKQ